MSISPKIMNEIVRFSKNSVYSLRSGIQLVKSSVHTVQFGSESMVYLEKKSEKSHRKNHHIRVFNTI